MRQNTENETSLPSEHSSETTQTTRNDCFVKVPKSDELLSTVVYETLELKQFSALITGRFQFFSCTSRATGKSSGNVIMYTRARLVIWLTLTVSAQLDEQKKL